MIYILAFISIIMGAVGQFLLKLGAGKISPEENISKSILSILFNVNIIIAIFSFALSMLIWVFVLRKLPLSIAYPMVSLGYIFVIALAVIFLKEPLGLYKVIGSLFIILGVIVLNLR